MYVCIKMCLENETCLSRCASSRCARYKMRPLDVFMHNVQVLAYILAKRKQVAFGSTTELVANSVSMQGDLLDLSLPLHAISSEEQYSRVWLKL